MTGEKTQRPPAFLIDALQALAFWVGYQHSRLQVDYDDKRVASLMATQIPPLVATSNSPTLSEVN